MEEETPSKKYEQESIKTVNKKRSDGLKRDTVTQVTKAEVYKPSSFIFTNNEGNITIVLPAGKQNQFRIKFLDEDGSDVFQLNSIREQIVIVDKSNFMRSGWFKFELYENDVLKEKNKILVPQGYYDPLISLQSKTFSKQSFNLVFTSSIERSYPDSFAMDVTCLSAMPQGTIWLK